MNGGARPYENSTANTAILPPDYRVKIEYVLIPNSGESFSVGLRLAKITEIWAKCSDPLKKTRYSRLIVSRQLEDEPQPSLGHAEERGCKSRRQLFSQD